MDKRYSNPYKVLDRLLGIQKFKALRICRQSAHEYGKVISPRHWLLYLDKLTNIYYEQIVS